MRVLRRICLVLATVGLVLPPAIGQWNKKPAEEWSDKDVQKLLNDSPWGRTQTFSDPGQMFRPFPNQAPAAEQAQTTPPNAVHINFRIRFMSARPVRLAVKRMMELKLKEKMSAEMAEHLKTFVSGDFKDLIVVTVVCDSPQVGANVQEAQSLLHNRGTAQLKNDTFLEIKGGKRLFLQEFQTPRNDGMGARFLFPRTVDGQPFITPETNEVRFFAELSSAYKLDRRFKIKDMTYEGKLEY